MTKFISLHKISFDTLIIKTTFKVQLVEVIQMIDNITDGGVVEIMPTILLAYTWAAYTHSLQEQRAYTYTQYTIEERLD